MMTQIRPGRVQTQPAWREEKQQPYSENVRVVCLGLTFYDRFHACQTIRAPSASATTNTTADHK